jgi:RNA methyltransferase, TrmH family
MKIHDIESTKNQIYQELLGLLSSPGIAEKGQTLIFGLKATEQIRAQHPESVMGYIVERDMDITSLSGIDRLYKLPNGLFNKIDIFGTGEPILIAKVPEIPVADSKFKFKGCTLVIPFQDPSNVGALLRTAAGFGVNQILLAKGCANPFHPKSTRAASGVIFSHKYFKFTSLEDFSLPCIALDSKGENLKEFKFPENFILIPGVEGKGLSGEIKSIATTQLSIPLDQSVDSLNATVATAIALYVWRAQNS